MPDRLLRASDFADELGRDQQSRNGRRSPIDETSGEHRRAATARSASAGARRASGTSRRRSRHGDETDAAAVARRATRTSVAEVAFPYFGNREHDHFNGDRSPERAGAQRAGEARASSTDGEALVATVFDLFVANYGVDRGFGGEHVAKSLRRRRALHAGLGREDHRRAARPDHHGGARVRAQRREDQGPLHGHHRRGDEPLVPHAT